MTRIFTLIFLTNFLISINLTAQKAFDEYIVPKTYQDQGSYTDIPSASNPDVQVNLFTNSPKYPVRQSLFGQNAVAWQRDIAPSSNKYINYKNANYSLLRYPGGNWSNIFFWDGNVPKNILTDGVVNGPADLKAGTDGWMLGTDEFPDLLNFTGSDGIVCVNVGWSFYGTGADPVDSAAQYAARWVNHYNNTLGAGIKYWELGNENYGSWQAGYSQGNPVKYANACVAFYNAMKAVDPTIELGVVLYEGAGGLSSDAQGKDWNEQVLPIVKDHMDFIIIHQYPHPESNRNNLSEQGIYAARASVAEVVEVIENQVATYTGKSGKHYPIAVTEFNSRTGIREISRSNTLFTALFLGEMADHNIGSAMQWSLDNGYDIARGGGGHGAVASGDPFMNDGDANSSLYTYYYMDKYFGDTLISSSSSSNDIVVYGTTFSSGEVGVLIVNISSNNHVVDLDVNGKILSDRYYYHQIKGDSSDFDRTLYVNGEGPSNSFTSGVQYCNGTNCATATSYEVNGVGGPQNYTSILPYSTNIGNDINAKFNVPAHSVTFMVFKTSSDQCAIPDLGANQTFCSASTIELNSQLNMNNKTFEWKDESNQVVGTSNKLIVDKPGKYTLSVDSNSCIAADEIIITSDFIKVNHDTICSSGPVDLSITETGTFGWFDAETGGAAIFTGNNYNPSITLTDTFYIENTNTTKTYNLGKSVQNGTISTFSDYTSSWKQLKITVDQDLKLESVSVFVNSDNSNVVLKLYEADGTTLVNSFSYNGLSTGKQILQIGEVLSSSKTYVIDLEGSDAHVVDWQDDNNSDNNLAGFISFINDAAWASGKYGFFYDWVISVDSPSPCVRTPVYAVIDPLNASCLTVEVEDLAGLEMNIYPNPTNGLVLVKSNLVPDKIEVIDIHGRVVGFVMDSKSIDISHFQAGSYFIRVTAKGVIKTVLMIKK